MPMAKVAVLALPRVLFVSAFARQPAQQPALAPLAVRWMKFIDPVESVFSIDVPARQ